MCYFGHQAGEGLHVQEAEDCLQVFQVSKYFSQHHTQLNNFPNSIAEDDASLEFKQLHRFNSSYQNLRTFLIVGQAVPGVFPLIFPDESQNANL